MGLVYDNRNIKVDYFSLQEIDDTKYIKKLIVYPVLEYKVFAPIFDDIKLNIFQKTVLSILNKGKYNVDKISQWLCMDKLLVQTILAELQIKGLFDSKSNNITQEGIESINGTFSWFTNTDNIKKDIRYIYQDVYSNNIYPVLIDKEKFHSKMYLEYRNKKLVINTKEKGQETVSCNLIEPKGSILDYITTPDNKEMFQAINTHAKIYIEDSDKNIDTIPEAIQILCDEPTLTFIATLLYIDKNNKNIDEFEVLDPFNIYDDGYWLKENLENASKSNDKLKDTIESLVIDAKEKEKEIISDKLFNIHSEVKKEILNTYDYNLQEFNELNNSIEEFYIDFKTYEYQKTAKYLKDAFRQSQIVLETLFHIIYTKYPKGYKDALNIDSKLSNIFTKEIERKVMHINSNSKIPQWKFSNNKFAPHIIKPALNNPKKASLKALYIGAILASWYDNTNPMHDLIKEKDDLLIFFESIAEGRNAVGHKYFEVKDSEIDMYFNEVRDAKSGIEQIIKIFLKRTNNG